MKIEIGFFSGDTLLCRGSITCDIQPTSYSMVDEHGTSFEITTEFGDPNCTVEVVCEEQGSHAYRSELQVPLHNSDDWESIELADTHTLAFRCVLEPDAFNSVH